MSKYKKNRRFYLSSLTVAGLFTSLASGLFLHPDIHFAKQSRLVATPESAIATAKRFAKSGHVPMAIRELEKVASQQNPHALLQLGIILARHGDTSSQLREAREKLFASVQKDFARRGEVAFELAKIYRKGIGEDCERIAFEWLSKSAEWGYAQAHAQLGKYYERGILVDPDLRRALFHFKAAASQGVSAGLVQFVDRALKLPIEPVFEETLMKAVNYAMPRLKKEALNGKPSAARALGRVFKNGRLVSADLSEAIHWFRHGVALGDVTSNCELALLLLANNPNKWQVEEALQYLSFAGSHNDGMALTESGRLHLAGKHQLPRKKAVKFFKHGVEVGHPGSMLELARLYLAGDMVEKDVDQAIALLKRGKLLGHSGSKSLLNKLSKNTTEPKLVSVGQKG